MSTLNEYSNNVHKTVYGNYRLLTYKGKNWCKILLGRGVISYHTTILHLIDDYMTNVNNESISIIEYQVALKKIIDAFYDALETVMILPTKIIIFVKQLT